MAQVRIRFGLGFVIASAATFLFVLTAAPTPQALEHGDTSPVRGAYVFDAAGCASCHMAPLSEDRMMLSGGRAFETGFGVFYAPNISMHDIYGLGGWTLANFEHALRQGVSPEGKHYFPVFPYTTYQNMTDQDVADLWAYMQTLPISDQSNAPHDVTFPFSVRRSIGGWKRLFLPPKQGEIDDRGQYLVEALGHCSECHTARNALGGWKRNAWLQGGPNPTGQGKIPGISSGSLDWSIADIAEYLNSGFTPDYDVAGGEMVDVIKNTSRLSPADRDAIATYLKRVK